MKTTPTFNSWVTCFRPKPQAKMRLFCFHYAGGGALIFRSWSDSLPPTVEVCAIELPGRGTQLMEPPFTQLEPLIQELTRVLLPYLNKPFAFFGHSMGALVSTFAAHVTVKDVEWGFEMMPEGVRQEL